MPLEIHIPASEAFGSATPQCVLRCKARIYYDYNNNVVKTEAEYKDGNNTDLPQWIEATYTYDILDKLVESSQRVNNNEMVTTRLRYDANENLIEIGRASCRERV